MKRWVILGAADINDYTAVKSKLKADDFIVSADGGQKHLEPLAVKADLYLGDFDSSSVPQTETETLTYPVEKDDTDTMLAIKAGLSRGAKSFVIFGGMGGRFDHTFANIQALLYAHENSATAVLADENNTLFILKNDCVCIEKNEDEKVSLFALNATASGITLEGFYYPLENGSLLPHDPMGVSNFVTAQFGKITVKNGTLLVVISKVNQ